MKLNTEQLKQVIASKITQNPNLILDLWDGEYFKALEHYLPKLQSVKTWKRDSKERDDDKIVRRFSPRTGCCEIDEQLVCYIETDITDTEILEVNIEA